jgi:putative ABC transport system ATP-binding protein
MSEGQRDDDVRTRHAPRDGIPHAEREDHGDVVLQADGVSKTYEDGGVRALADVSLEIRRGEFVAIMGRSGSGKSTLLNILGGLDRPSEGEVYFEGQSLRTFPNLAWFRARKLGFVFQSFHLLPVLTALENVQMPMFETLRSPARRREKAERLLDVVGMSHRTGHLPKQLSVGERQRVAVARALANDPVLVLADEPTGNLDSDTALEIIKLLAGLHRQRLTTIVMVTHDADLATCAERIIRMKDGQIVN